MRVPPHPCCVPFLIRILLLIIIRAAWAQEFDERSVLREGSVLRAGAALVTSTSSLVMHENCNLLLYVGTKTRWQSATIGGGNGCHLSLEENGILEILDSSNQKVWQTWGPAPASRGPFMLVLRSDSAAILGKYDDKTKTRFLIWATDIV